MSKKKVFLLGLGSVGRNLLSLMAKEEFNRTLGQKFILCHDYNIFPFLYRKSNCDWTGFLALLGMEILSFRGIVNLTANYILETMRKGGVLCMKQSKKTGPIAIALPVKEGEDIIIMTKNEMTIRINVSKIKLQSRVTSGVKLISLNKDDEVIAIGRIGPEDE